MSPITPDPLRPDHDLLLLRFQHADEAASGTLPRRHDPRHGRLSAVIDFGSCGVGDPACDLTIACTLFAGTSRAAFRTAHLADGGTWARARGWALWKSLITLAEHIETDPRRARDAGHTLNEVLGDALG